MTTSGTARGGAAQLNRGFGWLAALGVLLVIAGAVGLVYTGVATLTSMLLFGWLLLVGGVVGLLHAVQSRGTSFFWLGVIVAALNLAAGVVIISEPDTAATALTMFAALLFLTAGLFRLVGSVVVRGPSSAGRCCSAPSTCSSASWCWPPGRAAASTSSARSSRWPCSSTAWA